MENYTCVDIIDNLLAKNTDRLNALLDELKTKSSVETDEPKRQNISSSVMKLIDEFPNRVEIISECVINCISTNNISCIKLPLSSDLVEVNHPVSKNISAVEFEEWKRISYKFESIWRQKLRELLSIPTETNSENTQKLSKHSCSYLIRFYCVLFDAKNVWKLYKQIRREEFSKYLNVKSEVEITTDNYFLISNQISDKLLELITEDAKISDVIGISLYKDKDVVEVYLDSLSDYFENLSKEINDVNSQLTSNNVVCGSWKEIVLLEEEITEEYANMNQKLIIQDGVNIVLMAGNIEKKLKRFLHELRWIKKEEEFEKQNSKSSLKSKSSRVVIDSSKSNVLWDWRCLFVGYSSDLCQFVEDRIRNVTTTSLQQENAHLRNNSEIEFLSICLARSSRDPWIPRKVSLSVGLVGEIFEEMMMLATICDNELLSVRNAYLITSKQYSIEVINHIVRLSQGNSQNQVNFYLLLSSAVYFKTILDKIHEQFKDNMPFSPEVKHLSELIDTLIERIKFLNENLLCTGILHDVESQNWTNNKPFYEDGKCSFSIDMWITRMRWLKFHLSTTCCSNHAYEILFYIFKFSLSWFATRYSRVKPSFARVNQYRRDVVSILLFSSEFICTFYYDVNSSDLEIIHQHCNSLLIAVVVVTSPLNTLYKISKNGFDKWVNSDWSMISWMRVMRPVLWKKENEGDAAASELGRKLKFVCSQITPNWNSIVELLLTHDCLLSLMLVCHVIENSDEFAKNSSDSVYCEMFNCDRSSLCLSGSIDVVDAMLTFLAHCESMPHVLTMLLIRVFKRFNQLNLFLFSNSLDDELPSWILTTRNLLTPFCMTLISPIVDKILNAPSTPWNKVVEISNKIPGNKLTSEYRCDVISTASNLVDEFFKSLSLTPKPLLILFDGIENELIDTDKQKLTGGSVIVHVLSNHIYRLTMQRADIFSIRKEEQENLKAIARQFIHNLTTNEKMILKIPKHEAEVVSETSISIITWEITNNETAFTALQLLYKLIKLNEHWLVVNLGLESGDVKFNTNVIPVKDEINPVTNDRVDCITNIDPFPFDWKSLLECGMGMSETTFRLLLHRRCEFEDGAQLSEHEQKYVNLLINKYSFNV